MANVFEQPVWLWLLPVAAGLLVALEARARRRRTQNASMLGVPVAQPTWWSLLAGGLALACLALAVAGPRWSASAAVATAAGRDVAILLDVSRSMAARDVLPDRLGRARELALALVDDLARRGGQRVAVVAFAARPALVVPLTYDLDFARSALANLDPAELADTRDAQAASGTRIGPGVVQALESLTDGRTGARAVLLLSDGDDPARDGEWRRGATAAQAIGVPVFAVGIGDADRDSPVPGRPDARTRLQPVPLDGLATATGGRYLPLGRARMERVDALLADLPRGDDPDLATGRAPAVRAPFLLAAGALLLLAQWRPRAQVVGAVAAVFALAAGPVGHWLRRGDAALADGRPEQALECYTRAAERTTDPGLVAFNQGVALARLSRHREAELHFRRSLSDADGERRAQALYNLGTCLVRRSAGRDRAALVEAITTYRMAPPTDDLKHNLAVAEKLLAQLPPEPERGPDGEPSRPGDEEPTKSVPQPGPAEDKATPTDRPPPPGVGNLPPLPEGEATPIIPEDLERYLKQARERIETARRERLRNRGADKPAGVLDW